MGADYPQQASQATGNLRDANGKHTKYHKDEQGDIQHLIKCWSILFHKKTSGFKKTGVRTAVQSTLMLMRNNVNMFTNELG